MPAAPPPPVHQPLQQSLQPTSPPCWQTSSNHPHPSLKDDSPDSWTAPAILQWMRTFDPTVQESAKQVLRILQTSKVTTDQLKGAATRYGLPLNRVNKLTIKSYAHNNGDSAYGTSKCFLTLTTTTTFSPLTPFTSNSTSTPLHHNDATINMATILRGLHCHRHTTPRTQPPCRAQATSKQYPSLR